MGAEIQYGIHKEEETRTNAVQKRTNVKDAQKQDTTEFCTIEKARIVNETSDEITDHEEREAYTEYMEQQGHQSEIEEEYGHATDWNEEEEQEETIG